MEIVWFEDFIALAQELHFSKAAQLRNVTQPAFSRRIRSLENWLNAPLVKRTSRSVELTPAGQYLAREAQDLISNYQRLRKQVQSIAGTAEESLSIAATHALSFSFLPGLIQRQVDPKQMGALNVISDSMEECEAKMLRGEVEFLLCHGQRGKFEPLKSKSFKRKTVGSDTLLPLCAPNTNGKPLWQLLDGEAEIPLLAYSKVSGLGRIVTNALIELSLNPKFVTKVHAPLAITLQEMAKEGQGVAWLPHSLAKENLASGALVTAGSEIYELKVDIYLYRSSMQLSQRAEAFWQGLN